MPSRADIVLARFPFTDGSGAKLRPVLVLVELPGAYNDFVIQFITSQLTQAVPGLDVVLGPQHPAFAASGLKTASVFKVGKVASVSSALIVGGLGHLDGVIFGEIVRRLRVLIDTGAPP